MEEIKVGEYVRLLGGYIGKVENINDYRSPEAKFCIDLNWANLIFVGEKDVKNHSFDIKDLIGSGDLVNGKIIKMNSETGNLNIPKRIKSIVTKEKLKSVEYNIGQN